MKLLHAADLHIGRSRKLPGYLERQDQMLAEIGRLAKKYTDGLILIGGDVYDRFDLLPRERDLFIKHVSKWDADGMTTICISGNHDMIDEADEGYTHLRALKILVESRRLRNTTIIETHPEAFKLDKFDLGIIAVPSHYRKTKAVNEIVTGLIDQVSGSKYVVALVHETVLGAKTDYGKRIGIDIGSAEHCVTLDGTLPVTYWALGDIHQAQRIKGAKNAWYSGAPIQHDFGDSDDRGVLVVDLDKPREPELIQLKGVKRLVTVKVEDGKNPEIPDDAYVRLEGERRRIKEIVIPENVVATKLIVQQEQETIQDVKVADVFAGLPEILAELGINEDDQRWCLEEAEKLR